MITQSSYWEGKTLQEALERLMLKFEHPYRITKRDGVAQVVTRDYNPNRVNFDVEDGVIVYAHYG